MPKGPRSTGYFKLLFKRSLSPKRQACPGREGSALLGPQEHFPRGQGSGPQRLASPPPPPRVLGGRGRARGGARRGAPPRGGARRGTLPRGPSGRALGRPRRDGGAGRVAGRATRAGHRAGAAACLAAGEARGGREPRHPGARAPGVHDPGRGKRDARAARPLRGGAGGRARGAGGAHAAGRIRAAGRVRGGAGGGGGAGRRGEAGTDPPSRAPLPTLGPVILRGSAPPGAPRQSREPGHQSWAGLPHGGQEPADGRKGRSRRADSPPSPEVSPSLSELCFVSWLAFLFLASLPPARVIPHSPPLTHQPTGSQIHVHVACFKGCNVSCLDSRKYNT